MPTSSHLDQPTPGHPRLLTTYQFAVVLPTVAYLGFALPRHFTDPLKFIFWTAVVAAVELLPVPAWRSLRISLSFPLLIACAILYPPPFAASIALLGSFDPREYKREVPFLRALFNRCQIALAVLTAATVFDTFGASVLTRHWYEIFGISLVAVAAMYAVNVVLVTIPASLDFRVSPLTVLRSLRIGGIIEFLVSYVGLGLLGAFLARLFDLTSYLSVVTVVAPLVFARQMFFRSMALEEAHKELQDRARVMRALSDRMAEERQDERLQIAGYLHDDLAQTLFQLTLRLEMAKKRLSQGDLNAASDDLDDITGIKDKASNMIRSLVRDLHRSPIGRTGLADALKSLADDLSRGSRVRIVVDVVQIPLPPPIQLLIFQIARQGVMNALTHAQPTTIWISLQEGNDGAELQVRDDGRGFDTSLPGPEGHFGMLMMRERATVVNGTFEVSSEVGKGTTIAATFPRVWLEEQDADTTKAHPTDEDARSGGHPDGQVARGRAGAARAAKRTEGRPGESGDASRASDHAPVTRR